MSVLASSRPTHRGSGRATPQKSNAGSAPLTAANLATHHASGIGRAPSESSTSSRTSSTMSYLGDLDEDEFNQYLDDLRANRHATIARLRANARAAHGRAPGIPSGDTDPSSSSNNTGIDTPSGSADTPAGSADTPSESSDDSSSTITSTPTESTERGETFGQKLAKYLLSEGHGGEVSNLRGWQELCLASGAVVGKDRTTCREAIEKMNVNIYDVIEALQTERVAGGLVDLHTLGRYSFDYAKIMELRIAKANPMTRAFVRNLGVASGEYEAERKTYCSR